MGFNSVYRSLQEIFPQIDARILKAVAIEHSKDADAAADGILTDVLPYLTSGRSTVPADSSKGWISRAEAGSSSGLGISHRENDGDNAFTNGTSHANVIHLDEEEAAGPSSGPKSAADHNDCTYSLMDAVVTHLDEIEYVNPFSKLRSPGCEDAENSGFRNGAPHDDRTHLDEAVNESKVSSSCIGNGSDNQLGVDTMNEELIFLGKTREAIEELELGQNAHGLLNESKKKGIDDQVCMETENDDPIPSNKIISKNSSEQTPFGVSIDGFPNDPHCEWKDLDYSMANKFTLVRSVKEDTCVNDLLDPDNFVAEPVPLSVQVPTADSTDPSFTHHESQTSGFSSLSAKKDCSVSEMGSIEDDISRNSIVSQSNEICRTDILDEIIEDAKNNKKTLFSVMESVMNMMKEAEIQERAAQRAKEEAALGGMDILIKVEELKQMLAHAKEANSMHAGEVFGEKAILATEVRELQSRLLCLSDERDKSLATLEEMRQTLESRLAAAEDLRKAAEHEKLEREESARRFLADQEDIMENVVQESKLIAQAAEENSKLREFLVDRGRILDTLQGEISVICQDVRLLKERFDKRLPLSMSISSSQTSCKLASSGSSVKSMASVLVPEEEESSKKPENRSPGSPISSVTPKSRADKDGVKPDQNELSEDGWDILKDEEIDIET
ncbi:Ubiquitin system component Cue [Parasponia andersonii]|uniref:Ubiquitin system component Cue n=1 Tax=Parasponia andersonii TaxID=3476 RepID=A0A2P5CXM6_PARAD|nr:Ubiquitin system component Cue [Parasponia andersonii]